MLVTVTPSADSLQTTNPAAFGAAVLSGASSLMGGEEASATVTVAESKSVTLSTGLLDMSVAVDRASLQSTSASAICGDGSVSTSCSVTLNTRRALVTSSTSAPSAASSASSSATLALDSAFGTASATASPSPATEPSTHRRSLSANTATLTVDREYDLASAPSASLTSSLSSVLNTTGASVGSEVTISLSAQLNIVASGSTRSSSLDAVFQDTSNLLGAIGAVDPSLSVSVSSAVVIEPPSPPPTSPPAPPPSPLPPAQPPSPPVYPFPAEQQQGSMDQAVMPLVIVFGILTILAQLACAYHYYYPPKSTKPPVMARFMRVAPPGIPGTEGKPTVALGCCGGGLAAVGGETLDSSPQRARIGMSEELSDAVRPFDSEYPNKRPHPVTELAKEADAHPRATKVRQSPAAKKTPDLTVWNIEGEVIEIERFQGDDSSAYSPSVRRLAATQPAQAALSAATIWGDGDVDANDVSLASLDSELRAPLPPLTPVQGAIGRARYRAPPPPPTPLQVAIEKARQKRNLSQSASSRASSRPASHPPTPPPGGGPSYALPYPTRFPSDGSASRRLGARLPVGGSSLHTPVQPFQAQDMGDDMGDGSFGGAGPLLPSFQTPYPTLPAQAHTLATGNQSPLHRNLLQMGLDPANAHFGILPGMPPADRPAAWGSRQTSARQLMSVAVRFESGARDDGHRLLC